MRRPEGFDESVSPEPAEERPARGSWFTHRETGAPSARKAAAISVMDRVLAQVKDAVWPARETTRSPVPRPRPQRPTPQDREALRELRRTERNRRRHERREIRRFTRRTRRRTAIWLALGGIVVTMGGLLSIAVFSPLLALQTIEIDGTSRIPVADLEAAVDGQLGTPLALLDFDRLTEELGAFPLIRSYVTETLPPHTLVIHVVERQPIGSLATEDGFALVDPAGVEIERTAERIPGVPLIDTAGAGSGGAAFDSAVEVLVALPDAILSRLDTITATTRDDVRLTLVDTGATIIWGSADNSDYKGRALDAMLANVPDASEFNVSAPGQGTYTP